MRLCLFTFLFAFGWSVLQAQPQPAAEVEPSPALLDTNELTEAAPGEDPLLAPLEPPPPEESPRLEESPWKVEPEDGVVRRRSDLPNIFSNFTLRTNEVARDVIVIGGNADIHGTVEGSLIVIGGRARITGTVERETILVLSGAEIAETARLEQEAILIGGPFNIADGAYLGGENIKINFGNVMGAMEAFKAWLFEGLFLGRLLPLNVKWAWAVAAMFALVYFFMILLFPKPVNATLLALEERPVTSLAVGLLTMILFAPLAFLLAISVVGVIVIPFLKLALFLMTLFGKAALICMLGRAIGKNSGLNLLERLVPAFLIGIILLTVAYMVPVLGIIAWAITTVYGLGAAFVALASSFQREETNPPPPVRVQPPGIPVAGRTNPSIDPSAPAMEPPIYPRDALLLPRAGFWKRFLAAVLDLALLSILVPLVGKWVVLFAVAYFVTMWTWKGTTIGSIVLGLKIVRSDGSPLSFPVALVRSLSSIFSGMILFLGFFWAGWDRDKQAWHDKIAGTVVVRMPKGFALV